MAGNKGTPVQNLTRTIAEGRTVEARARTAYNGILNGLDTALLADGIELPDNPKLAAWRGGMAEGMDGVVAAIAGPAATTSAA